ncbi:MAG: cytochrome c [Nitrospiria bacterium]
MTTHRHHRRIAASTGLAVLLAGTLAFAATESAVQNGQRIFSERKCAVCHTLHEKGGKVGPDLSTVGATRDEAWLKAFLADPKSVYPNTIMPPFRGTDEERASLAAYLRSLR